MYAKICRHRYGTLGSTLKEGTHLKSKQGIKCLQFLEACVHPDPSMRLTAGTAKKDGWFTTSEWKKVRGERGGPRSEATVRCKYCGATWSAI